MSGLSTEHYKGTNAAIDVWYPALHCDSTCKYIEQNCHKTAVLLALNVINKAWRWINQPRHFACCAVCLILRKMCLKLITHKGCVMSKWRQFVLNERDVAPMNADVYCGNITVCTSLRVVKLKDWCTGGWFVIQELLMELSKLQCSSENVGGTVTRVRTVQFGSELFAFQTRI